MPISEGGELLDPANLVPLCTACHSRITSQAMRARASGTAR